MNDIPYSKLCEKPEDYKIMLLYDQQAKTFTEIAKLYQLSPSWIQSRYYRTKVKQISLYLYHIAFVLGHENNSYMRQLFFVVEECYQDLQYVCGYFEKVYQKILEEYRQGEPALPESFLQQIPPLRENFTTGEVKRLVREKDMGTSTKTLATSFHVTQQKIRKVYQSFYYDKAEQLLEQLQEKEEDPQEKKRIVNRYHKIYPTAKKRYDALVQDMNIET